VEQRVPLARAGLAGRQRLHPGRAGGVRHHGGAGAPLPAGSSRITGAGGPSPWWSSRQGR
jgi:hypothetical protein